MFGGDGESENPMEKMMKDPAMKEMIRQQSKTMMNKMYGELFKEIRLPADQKDKFLSLLLDNQMEMVAR